MANTTTQHEENSEKETKEKGSDFVKVLTITASLATFFWSVAKEGYWQSDTVFSVLFIAVSLIIYYYYNKHAGLRKFFTESQMKWFSRVWCFMALVICINFIFRPSLIVAIKENMQDAGISSNKTTATLTVTPTIATTITPGSTYTTTPTLTISPTPTPMLTIMPTNTQTLKYPDISIGLVDLGEGCLKPEIENKLTELGFKTDLIQFDIPYQDMLKYDVIYLSSGWSCKPVDIEKMSIKLENYLYQGGGLLIGNPELTRSKYEILFLPIDVSYKRLDKIEDYDSYNVCKYSDENCKDHWIIHNLDEIEFAYPETILSLPNNGNYWVLTRGVESHYPSLVIGSGVYKSFVLLPGGEFSSKEKTISDTLFVNIILWLSGDAPSKGIEEWY